jgi:hypothetical protein
MEIFIAGNVLHPLTGFNAGMYNNQIAVGRGS